MAGTDAEMASELAPAGIRFRARDEAPVRIPTSAASLTAICRREGGRVDGRRDEVVDFKDPDRVAKLNAGMFLL
jgi:hypothetical protein